jgi:hypothetical protein
MRIQHQDRNLPSNQNRHPGVELENWNSVTNLHSVRHVSFPFCKEGLSFQGNTWRSGDV